MPQRRTRIAKLFESHGAMVYRRARCILGNDADAEEATQEAFIRALRGLDDHRAESELSTWLYRIVTNYCINKLRDKRRRQQLMSEKVKSQTYLRPRSAGDMMVVRKLLSEAPDDRWSQAALCVYVDGMSHQEAAEVLQVSKRTVGNLLTRFQSWAAGYCAPMLTEEAV